MKVQDILSFIETLRKETTQIPCDADFLESLSKQFSSKKPSDDLTDEDITFIVSLYRTRWDKVFKSAHDYTLDPSKSTLQWITLAKQIAEVAKIPYLKVLMPTITNTKDPHDGSDLTETQTVVYFFVTDDGKTLCRKYSYFRYMAQQDSKLCICDSDGRVRPVTLDLLTRLERGTVAQFTVKDKEGKPIHTFDSFYDFMCRYPLASLGKSGKMPKRILPALLELIESYFILKSNAQMSAEARFAEFKKRANDFFNQLYDCDYMDVNYLYGQRVTYNKSKHTLLSVFLEIFNAKQLNIDEAIKKLAVLLFQYQRVLRAKSTELATVYKAVTESAEEASPDQVRADAYVLCRSLIVSLFTYQFRLSFCSTHKIYAWDFESSIPEELFVIYNLMNSLTSPAEIDFEKTYKDMVREYITPKLDDKTLWTWFTRDESVNKWLQHIKSLSLPEAGGYWFGGRAIVSALSMFTSESGEVRKRVVGLMDKVINTYVNKYESPKEEEYTKQLRVNILFSQLLQTLNERDRRRLLILVTVSRDDISDDVFIANCALHIHRELVELGYVPPPASSQKFFTMTSKTVTGTELTLPIPGDIRTLSELVEYYSKTIPVQPHLAKMNGVKDAIGKYLLSLRDTILSREDREKNASELGSKDPLGAYT